MKNNTIITLSFLLFANLLFPQKNLFIYKFLPHHEEFKNLYQANICGVENLNIEDVDSLVFYIFNEKGIKDGDIYIVFPKTSVKKNIDVNYTDFDFSSKEKKYNRRFRKIRSVFKKNKQFPDFLDRELVLIDAALVIQDTLSLTTNSTQLHSEEVQSQIVGELLPNKKKYVVVDLFKNNKIWTESGELEITDLDAVNFTENIVPSNLDPNRFYYTSEDSLFAFMLNVHNNKTKTIEQYKIFRSFKSDIPEDLDLRDETKKPLRNYAYSFKKPQTPIRINKNNETALVEEKYSKKYITMTDYPLEETTDGEGNPIYKAKKSSTVASPGSLKTFWIPATSALLVFLSAL